MKVALVSSWLPRKCGIAIYSNDLAISLKKLGVELEIFCHTDVPNNLPHVHPVIDTRRGDWQDILYNSIEIKNPDLVHIQHEYGLYTLKRDYFYDFSPANSFILADALFRWKLQKRPLVITYHSVYSKMTFDEVEYYKYFSDLATANIVHEVFQKYALIKSFGKFSKNNFFAIPHGTWSRPIYDKDRQKALNGWEDKLVVGMTGFFEQTKGFKRIISLWPKVIEQVPNALLVIEGTVRPGSPSGTKALAELITTINKCSAKKNIVLQRKYFTWPENNNYISGFDLLVLPYLYASQSGNMAHGYGAGLPMVASNIEGLASSMVSSKAGIVAKTDKDFLDAIIRILKDSKLREKYSRNSLEYGKKIDWIKTGKKHLEIYRWAINESRKPIGKYLNKRTHV